MVEGNILFLTTTDQRESPLAQYTGTFIKGSFNRDANFCQPLREIFPKMIRYDYWKRLVEVGSKTLQKEILEVVKHEKPRFVTLPLAMYEISATTLSGIRNEGAIVVVWLADDECRFDNYSKWWIPYVDYFCTSDRTSISKYVNLGARCYYVPCAADLQLYRPTAGNDFEYEVSFVGANIGNRTEMIQELHQNNIYISVFGDGWGRFLSLDHMTNIFRKSKINFNFTGAYLDPQIKQLKARIFEVTMCGGFLLTEYAPGLEDCFEIDEEVVCFTKPEEAIEKINYYLSHEEERRRIAQAGCERTHRDHTWKQRLTSVFEGIETDLQVHGCPIPPEPNAMPMPLVIRRQPSNYHLAWAKALFAENRYGWQDELALALQYDPSNIAAHDFRFSACFPKSLQARVEFLLTLPRKLLYRLSPRRIKQWVTRKWLR